MNIIVIIADTYRYDNLFERALMPVRTPHLDRFSEQAVSLSGLYTGSFPTIPHRTDFTSGRYVWPWHPWQDRRMSSQNHLPSLLRPEGYVSQLIGDCPHLMQNGFGDGFDGAYTLRGQEGDTYFLHMNQEIPRVMPPQKTREGLHFQDRNLVDLHRWSNATWRHEGDRFAARTAHVAVEWLEENYRFDPFFLWVDFFDPHEPWDPPEYMVRRYDPDYKGAPMLHPNYGMASDYTPEELNNLRAHYCAEAEMVDRWVGRVLQKIDDLDLWRNSIVVWMSDHGMSLGEHNRTGKSNINSGDDRFWPVYPEVAHIPFLIRAPALPAAVTVDALLQPVDITPTLADLAGLQLSPPQPFHGKSFAPLLRGQSQQALHDFVITAQHLRREPDQPFAKKTTPVLYTDRWAYAPLGPSGQRELYDLAEDPYAEQNIALDHSERISEMHELVLNWLHEIHAPAEALSAIQYS